MIDQKAYHIDASEQEKEFVIIQNSLKDRNAFSPIYTQYHEPIFRYVYQRIDDKEIAFDITQQVFVKALVNLHKFSPKGVPFVSWLYRIAYNETMDAIKKNKTTRTINIDNLGFDNLLQETELQQEQIEKEKSLTRCLSSLKENELNMVEMRFFESKAFKEIADFLSITENNAKVKIYRILDKLKSCLTSNS